MPSKDWSAGLVRDPKTDHIIIRFKDPHWQQKTTPYRWSVAGDEERALKLAAQKERQVKERKAFADASGSVTVRSFGEKWIVGRKGNTSCVDDEQRLEDYVYPAIGHSCSTTCARGTWLRCSRRSASASRAKAARLRRRPSATPTPPAARYSMER